MQVKCGEGEWGGSNAILVKRVQLFSQITLDYTKFMHSQNLTTLGSAKFLVSFETYFQALSDKSKQFCVPGLYRSILQLFVNDTLHNNINPYPTILSSVLYSLKYSPVPSFIFKTGIFTSKRDFSQSRNAYPFILNYNVHYLFPDVEIRCFGTLVPTCIFCLCLM